MKNSLKSWRGKNLSPRFVVITAGWCAALWLLAAPAHAGTPVITGFNPGSGPVGTAVTITGTDFDATASNNIVYFGAVRAPVVSSSATSLTVLAPIGATYKPLSVTAAGLTACASAPFIETFPNGGTIDASSFAAPVLYNAGAGNGVGGIIADFDGDGKPDVALLTSSPFVLSILRNTSASGGFNGGSFAPKIDFPIAGTSNLGRLVAADVDGDGKLDLVVANFDTGTVSIFRNISTPGSLTTNSFAPRVDFAAGTGAHGVAVGDLDGDGKLDIAVANYSANTISILRNTGTAGSMTTNSFAPKVDLDLAAGSGPLEVALGDLDGDGKMEIVASSQSSSGLAVFRNVSVPGSLTSGSFAARVDLSGPSSLSVALGDVDGDGKLDIVAGSYSSQVISVFRNACTTGNISSNLFGPRVDFAAGGSVHAVAFGDLNGDGKLDLAVVAESPSHVSIFRNVATPGSITAGSLAARVDLASGWNPINVAIGDLDGDARPEIINVNQYDHNLGVYRNLQVSCTPAPANLVSWWRAEGTASDTIGTNNGTLFNGVSYVAGKVGQAFSLDGTNGFILVPASASLNVGLSNGLTIEGWINPTAMTPQRTIVQWNNGGTWGTHFMLSAGDGGGLSVGGLYANLLDTSGGNHLIWSAPGIIVPNQSQHVAVTYDKSSGVAIIYLNGVVVAQQSLGIFTPQTSYNFYLGYILSASGAFSGLLDEISLYSRALSTSEIAAIYNAGSNGKCSGPVPPSITTQPVSQTNFAGTTASFSVTATGTQPLSYQWSWNTTNLAGATNATLTLANVQLNQAGSYSVLVTNPYGATNSATATLTVNPQPPCAPPPSGLVAWWRAESNAADSISTNNGGLSNGVSYVAGEAGQAFFLDGTSGFIQVPASASLNVGLAGGFTIEGWINPQTTATQRPIVEWNTGGTWGAHFWISSGSGGSLSVGALYANVLDTSGRDHLIWSGPGLLVTNQFQHVALTYDKSSGVGTLCLNGVVVAQQNLGVFTPQTSYNLYLGRRPGSAYLSGLLDEISLYSRALSTSEIAAVYNAGSNGKCFTPVPPIITTQPASQTNFVGTMASFSVTAAGTQPLSYQWSFNTTNIVGATNASLTLANVQLNQAGDYSVLVTNAYGATNSATATLTVNPPPAGGLVAWWRAEGNAYDSLGTNHGTLFNGVSYVAGEVGQAFSLDGTSGYVFVPASSSLNVGLANGLTIEGWINPTAMTPQRTIVQWNNGGTWGTHFMLSAGNGGGLSVGGLYANLLDTSGGNHLIWSAPGLIVANQFQHIAVTYDKSSGVATIYLNGVVVAQQSLGVFTPQTSYDFNLGNILSASGAFSGLLDEISLYSRALSTSEIAAIYTAGSAGKVFTPTPPVISAQPADQTVNAGGTASFVVGAGGSWPLSFQWTLNGTNLAGGMSASLVLTNVQPEQAGTYAVVVTNLYGATVSSNALLTVLTNPPTILAQPTNQTVSAGTNVSFAVVATGPLPMSYQWLLNGGAIPSATAATLNLTNVQVGNAGTYSVVLSNAYGLTVSSNALLTVLTYPPTLLTQPASRTVFQGLSVSFAVTVSGSLPLSYQWLRNGTNVPGATASTLTLTNLQLSQSGSYAVQVTNLYGAVLSSNAVLSVVPPQIVFFDDFDPVIHTQQWSGFGTTVLATNYGGKISGSNSLWFGGTGSRWAATRPLNTASGGVLDFFLRIASGTATTWETADLPGEGIVVEYSINGGTSWVEFARYDTSAYFVWTHLTVHIPLAAQTTTAQFRWRQLSNSGPSNDHWALDDVGVWTLPQPPQITAQPTNQTVAWSGNVSFAVTVTGTTPLSYQWFFNGGVITDATNAVLNLSNVQMSDAGNYAVQVSNMAGSVASSNAVLTVNAVPPSITTQPVSQTVAAGSTASFTAAVTGTPLLSYQWFFRGAPLAEATNLTLTLANVTGAQAGTYALMVTNQAGFAISATAFLSVNALVRAGSTNVVSGGTVSVPVQLLANGQENALQFSLRFDPALLTCTSVALGGGGIAAGATLSTDFSQAASGGVGVAVILGANATFPAGVVDLVTVSFTAGMAVSNTPVAVTFGDQPMLRQLSDMLYNELPAAYSSGTVLVAAAEFEGDIAPRPNGNGTVTITDWVLLGRYVARLEYPTNANEFQRADCAPRATLGDGQITVADWVQVGRYVSKKDPATLAGGPTNETTGFALAAKGATPRGGSGARQVSVAGATILRGQTGAVSVCLVAQGTEQAFSFSLNFDPAACTYVSATLGSGAGGATLNVNTNSLNQGRLGFALAYPDGHFAVGTDEVVRVNFKPTATAVGNSTIAFGDQPVPCGLADTNVATVAASYLNGTLVLLPSLPVLRIARSGAEHLVAWPDWGTNFVLQTVGVVAPTATWSNAPVTPVLSNGENTVIMPSSGVSNRYYRLLQSQP